MLKTLLLCTPFKQFMQTNLGENRMKLTTGEENVCLKDLGHNLGTPERAGWVSLAFRGGRETPILPCRGWDCACVEAGRRDLPRQHVG